MQSLKSKLPSTSIWCFVEKKLLEMHLLMLNYLLMIYIVEHTLNNITLEIENNTNRREIAIGLK